VPITHLIFDLDDTLYPPGNGLWDEIGERINHFLIEHFAVDPGQVNVVRKQYYQTHGTTLRGLMMEHPGMDADDYLAYVHAVDVTKYIQPDPALDAMLAALSQVKVIFTNSDSAHSRRVLDCLHVARHFDHIVDIRAMKFENKPRPGAYQALLDLIGAPASQCLFVEDSLRNLRPAKALGMTTLLVGNGHDPDPAVDYQLSTILDVGRLVHDLNIQHPTL
jgi:putative hydrolase of the HAD superfamily